MRRLLAFIGFALILSGCVLPGTQTPPAIITNTPGVTVTEYPTLTWTPTEVTPLPSSTASGTDTPNPTLTPVPPATMTPTNPSTDTPVPPTATEGFSTPTPIGPNFTPTWEATPIDGCFYYPCMHKAGIVYVVVKEVCVRNGHAAEGTCSRVRPVGEEVLVQCLIQTSPDDWWIREEDCFSSETPHYSALDYLGTEFMKPHDGPVGLVWNLLSGLLFSIKP